MEREIKRERGYYKYVMGVKDWIGLGFMRKCWDGMGE